MDNRPTRPNQQIYCVLLVIALEMAALVSCIPWDRPVDRSLLTDSPCAAPCWQGITPGKTSRLQALQILRSSRYIQEGSIREGGTEERGGAMWGWKAASSWTTSISWQKGIVQEICLALTYDLTVEQVVAKFGPPEALTAAEGGVPEHWYEIVVLYYPQRGVEFKAVTQEYSGLLEPSTAVRAALLFAPTTLAERISQEYGDGSASVLRHIREWKGYGDLRESYGLP